MSVNEDLIGPYVVYLAVALGLTLWLAGTAIRLGRRYLHGVSREHPERAGPLAHLLAVGVATAYLGIACSVMQPKVVAYSNAYEPRPDALAFLVGRIGALLLLFGVLHLVPLFAFWHQRAREARPPLSPAGFGRLPASPPPAP